MSKILEWEAIEHMKSIVIKTNLGSNLTREDPKKKSSNNKWQGI
jgi:hypothetical protein